MEGKQLLAALFISDLKLRFTDVVTVVKIWLYSFGVMVVLTFACESAHSSD